MDKAYGILAIKDTFGTLIYAKISYFKKLTPDGQYQLFRDILNTLRNYLTAKRLKCFWFQEEDMQCLELVITPEDQTMKVTSQTLQRQNRSSATKTRSTLSFRSVEVFHSFGNRKVYKHILPLREKFLYSIYISFNCVLSLEIFIEGQQLHILYEVYIRTVYLPYALLLCNNQCKVLPLNVQDS